MSHSSAPPSSDPNSGRGSAPAPSTDAELTFNNAPNLLTLARIGFVPIVVAMLYVRDPLWDIIAAFTFAGAGITDYFDGYLARTRNSVTVYGKLMDPLADKFLVVCSLIMLQELGRIHAVVVMLLICRELAITGLRALASAEGVIIGASRSAKWKTATQMTAIPFIMGERLPGIPLLSAIPFLQIGMVLLYVSLAISLWSALDYIVDFFRQVKLARKSRQSERRAAREARLASRRDRLAARAAKGRAQAPTDPRDGA